MRIDYIAYSTNFYHKKYNYIYIMFCSGHGGSSYSSGSGFDSYSSGYGGSGGGHGGGHGGGGGFSGYHKKKK